MKVKILLGLITIIILSSILQIYKLKPKAIEVKEVEGIDYGAVELIELRDAIKDYIQTLCKQAIDEGLPVKCDNEATITLPYDFVNEKAKKNGEVYEIKIGDDEFSFRIIPEALGLKVARLYITDDYQYGYSKNKIISAITSKYGVKFYINENITLYERFRVYLLSGYIREENNFIKRCILIWKSEINPSIALDISGCEK